MADARSGEPGLLGERYELQGLIGRGGMAEVHRAHDRVLDRPVAVKLLLSMSGDDAARARFADEARTLAGLSHPGLVTVLDASVTGDQPYLVMELVRGPSLAECCRGVPLEPARVASIGAQLADALTYAHACGIVHRDLKPGNVLLADDDRALLTDFGIARLLTEAARHTATGVTVGTAAYLAPEQVRGEDVTPAADVYSLGLVLLEALTGERAYGGSPTEAALARLTAPPPIPWTVPTAWVDLLTRMTALAPDDRPSTEQVADALRQLGAEAERAGTRDPESTRMLTGAVPPVQADEPAADTLALRRRPSRRSAETGRASEFVRRHLHGFVAVAAACVVLLAVLVAVAIGNRGETPTPTQIPSGVPAKLQQPLQNLHDAVEGQP